MVLHNDGGKIFEEPCSPAALSLQAPLSLPLIFSPTCAVSFFLYYLFATAFLQGNNWVGKNLFHNLFYHASCDHFKSSGQRMKFISWNHRCFSHYLKYCSCNRSWERRVFRFPWFGPLTSTHLQGVLVSVLCGCFIFSHTTFSIRTSIGKSTHWPIW